MGISRENMQNSSSLGQYDDEKSDTEGSGGAKVPDPFVPRLHSGDSTRFLKTGTMKRFAFHVSKCENYCSNKYIIIIYINI